MFDLITGKTPRMPGGGGVATLFSSVFHAGLLGAVVAVPLLFVTNTLPPVPTMTAFVAAAPPPPAPPPPPPAPRAKDTPATVAPSNQNAAPVAAPSRIEPEPAGQADIDNGAVGGVEGGIPGGVAGGIVGGLAALSPPPPPPAPPAMPSEPVHVGGEIRPPTLLRRVEPTYPDLALNAHVEGTVILEAIIDESGTVQRLKVLRSIQLLDKAAITAVQQWRYSPVILNGKPVPVILTVVISFKIPAT